jgi:hypothetical protein
LLASNSGTSHTKALAGLFTAAWQHRCQFLHAWAPALVACWGIQLLLVSFNPLAATMTSTRLSYAFLPILSLPPWSSQARMHVGDKRHVGFGL